MCTIAAVQDNTINIRCYKVLSFWGSGIYAETDVGGLDFVTLIMAAVVLGNEAASASGSGSGSGSASATGSKEQAMEEVGTLKKGPWTSAEDAILVEYVKKHGEGNWNAVQKHSGLSRCGKSCRLRWANHLRPNLKKGAFTPEEERIILELHAKIGNKWARMAAQLPGRTDNEIKNYWNTRIKRRQRAGLPLYPPDIQLQNSNKKAPQTPAEINSVDATYERRPPNDPLMFNSKTGIVTASFEGLNHANVNPMPFSGLGNVSLSSMFNQGNPIQRLKRLRDTSFLTGQPSSAFGKMGVNGHTGMNDVSKNIQPCFKARHAYPQAAISDSFTAQGRFPYDPVLNNTSMLPLGGFSSGSHAVMNGTFSASRPFFSLKPELPSSQFAESVQTAGSSINPIQQMNNPVSLPRFPTHMISQVDYNFSAQKNSGLLEAMLQEAETMSGVKAPISTNSSVDLPGVSNSSSSNPMDNVFPIPAKIKHGDNSDPTTPLDGHTFSVFSESTPPLGASLWDESSSAQSPIGKITKTEEPNEEYISSDSCGDENISSIFGFTETDVLPDTDWNNHIAEMEKEQSLVNNALTMFNDELGMDVEHRSSITPPSSQTWGVGSCPWSNLPSVC